jgi:hypothetical protein
MIWRPLPPTYRGSAANSGAGGFRHDACDCPDRRCPRHPRSNCNVCRRNMFSGATCCRQPAAGLLAGTAGHGIKVSGRQFAGLVQLRDQCPIFNLLRMILLHRDASLAVGLDTPQITATAMRHCDGGHPARAKPERQSRRHQPAAWRCKPGFRRRLAFRGQHDGWKAWRSRERPNRFGLPGHPFAHHAGYPIVSMPRRNGGRHLRSQ